jgi:N-acetylneuraminate synthase
MKNIQIGPHQIGPNEPVFVVAEIGINHNGDLNIAKKLIEEAAKVGCDAVKFQKRTVDVVYTTEELARPRESPFGKTNGDLKKGLEFGKKEYDQIDLCCKKLGIRWFASAWDEDSVDFLKQYSLPCWKIASASLTDTELLIGTKNASGGAPLMLSTGMSSLHEIRTAAEVLSLDDLIILHCKSTYPAKIEELNLNAIHTLRTEFDVPIGYSGHEVGIFTSLCAVAMGACVVERHITLDRSMWGTDQSASVEPKGLKILIENIRLYEKAKGDGVIRCLESEEPIKQKLRRK